MVTEIKQGVSLLGVHTGQDVRVVHVASSYAYRLQHVGIFPGTHLRILKRLPFKGPVVLLVRGSMLCLRYQCVAAICVTEGSGDDCD